MKNKGRKLLERPTDFEYDYRMKCECGETSLLRSADYADEINDAHRPCEHCGDSIHFGRAVIAMRGSQRRTRHSFSSDHPTCHLIMQQTQATAMVVRVIRAFQAALLCQVFVFCKWCVMPPHWRAAMSRNVHTWRMSTTTRGR